MIKHSPAPWYANGARSPVMLRAANGDGLAKVYLTDVTTRKRDEEHLANLRLVVRAPELLRLAKEVAARGSLDSLAAQAQELIAVIDA